MRWLEIRPPHPQVEVNGSLSQARVLAGSLKCTWKEATEDASLHHGGKFQKSRSVSKVDDGVPSRTDCDELHREFCCHQRALQGGGGATRQGELGLR